MEDFIVSARKYRPTTFDSVVGQKSITSTLKNAIKNHHLAQAFLFCGPRGVGKTTCARILAKTINCFNITDNIEACDECESCRAFNESHSFNIHELDAASNNSVEDIRNLVEQVRFAPQVGKYSIYIIDEVHMLSQAAFNAFLKTLEEPPSHAIFILATTEKHKIIPTILSRCQIFDFHRIQVEDIVDQLHYIAEKENINAEDEALHIIGQKADGALRDALSLFDQIVSFAGDELTYKAVIENLNILDYDYYFKATDALLENDVPDVLLLFNEILDNGFDGHNFINGLGSHFRNLLVCKDVSTHSLLEVGQNIKDRYWKQAEKCTPAFLLKALNTVNKCDINYRTSRNQRLLVELTLIHLGSLAGKEMKLQAPEKKTPDTSERAVKNSTVTTASPKNKAEEPTTAKEEPKQNKQPEATGPAAETEVVKPEPPKSAESPAAKTEAPVAEKLETEEKKADKTKEEPTEEPIPTAEQKQAEEPDKDAEEDNFFTRDDAEQKRLQRKKLLRTKSVTINEAAGAQAEEEEESEEDYADKPQKAFTEEALHAVWAEYAEMMEAEGKMNLFITLSKHQPVIKDNFEIEFLIDNRAQEEQLAQERSDLMEFVRSKLQNYAIELKTKLNKKPETKKAYTDRDKFKKMAEKNPNLYKLRKQLDLDI